MTLEELSRETISKNTHYLRFWTREHIILVLDISAEYERYFDILRKI